MATNQESLQASLRARSGSTKNLTFNGDWVAVFDFDSIPAGQFNERLLNWINARLSTSYTSLLRAQSEFAASLGVVRWSDLTTIGSFNPLSLFGAAETGYIFDLSDNTTTFQDNAGSFTTPAGNGDPVGSLKDKSPNGNHLTQSIGGAFRPTFSFTGGKGFLTFDNAQSQNLKKAFTLNQTFTIVAAFRYISVLGLMMDGAGANFTAFLDVQGPGTTLYMGAGNGDFGDNTISAGEDFVVTARFSGATSRMAKNNGAYVSNGNPGANNAGGVSFGSQGNSNNGGVTMRLYRAIGIGRDMTDPEITNARAWCQAGI